MSFPLTRICLAAAALCSVAVPLAAQQTHKPSLHAKHWIAITGKPLGATAGALMFARGGNAVDAACAMLAAVTTMWDVLSWGERPRPSFIIPRSGR
jgi:gamma-glutamyltranspeptidase / glutathione hydrolase